MSDPAGRAWKPTDIGVDGPTPRDMARSFLSIRADPLSFLGRMREQYGNLVAFPVPGPPVLLVNRPADVGHVLRTSARHWGKQTVQYAALAQVTGPGLLASSSPDWIAHRRAAAPAFHHHRLTRIGDEVRTAADAAVAGWSPPRGTGPGPARESIVDVVPLTLQIALDAVGRALFSADLSGQAQRLLDASSQAARLVVRLGRQVVPLPAWAPTPTQLRIRVARRRLDSASAELIVARRRAVAGTADDHGSDLLGLLVDSGLSDDQIRSELVTMIIAGHETVATALAWTLMLLAQHPAAQDRLRAEVSTGGCVGLLDHAERLPWTRAVVDEALRLYPPAWVISRRSARPDRVGGVAVPAGTTAIISPWLLHRDPDQWPDPSAFRPERFVGAAARPAGYLPFGEGPRLCIGREFALGEMVIVLSRLLRRHRVDLPTSWTPPRPEAQVAVHPRGGMPLRVTSLDPPAG